MRKIIFIALTFLSTGFCHSQQKDVIYVYAGKPGATIQSTMWGIFFEDINFAADGGIYAEMVKNRSFEFSKPLMGWNILKNDTTSGIQILNRSDSNPSNPRFARITLLGGKDSFALSNEGFRGMGIKKGMKYYFSVMAKPEEGSSIKLRIELVSTEGEVLASTGLVPDSKDWKKYQVNFESASSNQKANLIIWFEGNGSLDIDMVSLFPADTWKNRSGGLRSDLVQLLAELKPGFIRFPGGCIVEGRDLANRYQWKKTIGPVEERKLILNRWNNEFDHRPAPDYFQSFGMGFFEYFQLAEDIGAEPVPILNCGMACQYNTAELVPLENLDPYIQDALDLIEFANGSAETRWGKIRIALGHPAPFNLKFLGVGNEQWGEQYFERYELFVKVIHEKYPGIRIISGTGPAPSGKDFTYASRQLRKLNAQIVDEHYYANPAWFFKNATRYDTYDRNSYKIFAGEYAAQSKYTGSPENQNNWICALAEAAFMTGLERNAEVVHMASYAPLFAHVEGWQWTPDLIWFDNLSSYGTPSYYVQKLFSTNRGTQVLSMLRNNKPLSGQDSLYGSATFDQGANEIILKIVNSSGKEQRLDIRIEGTKSPAKQAKLWTMQSIETGSVNSIENPILVSPSEQNLHINGKQFNQLIQPYSFSVFRIKLLK